MFNPPFIALIMCLVVAALRVRPMVLGRGAHVFWASLCLAGAIALSIPPVYIAVDTPLGGMNLANWILRFLTFIACMLIGHVIAVTHGLKATGRILAGPIGISALVSVALIELALLLVAQLPATSPNLTDYGDVPLIGVYSVIGRLYPAMIAAVLLPGLLATLRLPTRSVWSRVITLGFFVSLLGVAVLAVLTLLGVSGILSRAVAGVLDVAIYASIGLFACTCVAAWIRRMRLEQQVDPKHEYASAEAG